MSHRVEQADEGFFKFIKNANTLSSHGNIEGRQIVLNILEAGIKAADPYLNTYRLIRVMGDKLIIGCDKFDLSKTKNIYVIGAGKAVQRMARAVEERLGDRLTEGHINIKKGDISELKKIEVTFASHPIPDESCLEGAQRIMEIAKKANKDDIVIYLGSGGATSLSALPPPEINLEDLKKVHRLLYFDRGIPIWDLNVIRHHLSIIGDGRLNMHIYPAKCIFLVTSELWPEENTHHMFTSSTFKDAVNIAKKYNAWHELPTSVRAFLEKGGLQYELPTKVELSKVFYRKYEVMNAEYMLRGAKRRAKEMKLRAIILGQRICAEARDASRTLASIAREIEQRERPFKAPCVLISGGELIVTMGEAAEKDVKGGRNQEVALAGAMRIEGSKRITIGSIDSDGTDGPTNVAGGVSDGCTMERAKALDVDIHKALQEHNSYDALTRLQDTVYTGSTGTNVQDLRVIYVSS